MKKSILLFFILNLSFSGFSQIYEANYEKMPTYPDSLLFVDQKFYYSPKGYGYPIWYYTSYDDYFWSNDGRWLYFTVKHRAKSSNYTVRDKIKVLLFVAGPFDQNNSIVKVKYIMESNSIYKGLPKYSVSPDQKKLALYYGYHSEIIKYNQALTSLNDFIISEKYYWDYSNLNRFYEQKFLNGDNLIWSNNSDILYPETFNIREFRDKPWIYTFYSSEFNNSITITISPRENDTEIKNEISKIVEKHNELIKKEKNKYTYDDLIGDPWGAYFRFTDDYIYAKVDKPTYRLNCDKKGTYKIYKNPFHNKIYRYSKVGGEWQKTDYFPEEAPKDFNAEVIFEPKVDSIYSGGVKGSWGQQIEESKIIRSYKLIFNVDK